MFKGLKRIEKLTFAIIASATFLFGTLALYDFKKKSADGRLLIWKVTSQIIKKNPYFGVGHDRFKTHYMNEQAEYFARGESNEETTVSDNTNYAFNEVLQFTTENGALGLIIIVGLGIFILRLRSSKSNSFLKPILVSVVLTILIFGSFSYPFQILPIKMVALIAIVILAGIDSNKILLNFKKNKPFVKNMYMITGKFVFIITSIFIITYTLKRVKNMEKEYKKWGNARYAYSLSAYENSVLEYEKISGPLLKSGEFLTNYGKALTLAGKHERALEALNNAKLNLNNTIIETTLGDSNKALKNYKEAELAYKRAANMVPSRFYPQYLLAKLYIETKQTKKAVEKAKLILNKKVKIPSMAIDQIQAEMKKIILKYEIKK